MAACARGVTTMLNNPVLVTYATKHGATLDIAVEIAARLREAGLTVEVLPVAEAASLRSYGAVVFGSAVYAGQWPKEATAFLDRFYSDLALRPVWIFSSGPTGEGDPIDLLKGWKMPADRQKMIERIEPEDVTVFHGRLDRERLNLAERLMVRAVNAPAGDFRDWDAIRAWADGIATELLALESNGFEASGLATSGQEVG